jgi:hypothetical protein
MGPRLRSGSIGEVQTRKVPNREMIGRLNTARHSRSLFAVTLAIVGR